MNNKPFLLFIIIIACIHCSGEEYNYVADIPEHIQQQENITIYPADVQTKYEVNLKREVVFGDTDDVFLSSSIRHLTTDRRGRVYMADMNEKVVHVYAPDGSHLRQIGRGGQGPRELQWIAAVRPNDNYINLLDSVQSKISIFDSDTFEHQKDISIAFGEGVNDPSWLEWTHEKLLFYSAIDFHINSDGNYLIISEDPTVGALDNFVGRTWELSVFDPEAERYLQHDIITQNMRLLERVVNNITKELR